MSVWECERVRKSERDITPPSEFNSSSCQQKNSAAHDLHLTKPSSPCVSDPTNKPFETIHVLYAPAFEKLARRVSASLPTRLHLAKGRTVVRLQRRHLWASLKGVTTAGGSPLRNHLSEDTKREGSGAAGDSNGVTGVWVCEWTEGVAVSTSPLTISTNNK